MKEHWMLYLQKALAKLNPIWDLLKTSYQNDRRIFIESMFTSIASIGCCTWIVLYVVLPIPILPKPTAYPHSLWQILDMMKPVFLHTFALCGALLMIVPLARVWAIQVHLIDSIPIFLFNHIKRIQTSKISK